MMRRFLHLQSGELSGSTIGDGLSEGPGHFAKDSENESIGKAMMSEGPAIKQRELTFGEKAVGLSFNPGGNPKVNDIKRGFADIIDYLHNQRLVSSNPDEQRMLSLAITEAQTSQMWAVKAVTWNS